MVKGNWERRVEMSKLRREVKRGTKELRTAGLAADQIVSKILAADPEATVFLRAREGAARRLRMDQQQKPRSVPATARAADVEQPTQLRPLCRLHFEAEACDNRRCKWSHTCTIAHFDGAAAMRGSDSGGVHGGLALPAVEQSLGPSALLWPANRLRLHGISDRAPDEPSAARLVLLTEPLLHVLLKFTAAPSEVCAIASACKSLYFSTLTSPAVDALKSEALPRMQTARCRFLVGQSERVLFVGSSLAAFGSARAASGPLRVGLPGGRRGRATLVHAAADVSVWQRAETRAAAAAAAA